MDSVNRPVMLVDAMGIVHNISNELNKMEFIPPIESYIRCQMQWLGSGRWWNGFSAVPNVVMCWDSKPYWRYEYLLRDEVWQRIHPVKRRRVQEPAPILYKFGRSKSPLILDTVKTLMYKVCAEYGWHQLKAMATESHGYEADDMAALCVRLNRINNWGKQIYLVTRDKDWMGLIGSDVTWLCCNNDNPRVRTCDNWKNSFKENLINPTDIWEMKARSGDASDNLPNCGGCAESYQALLPVISLFEPPQCFDPIRDQQIVNACGLALVEGTPEARHIDNAARALTSKGLAPCIPRIF